MSVCLARSAETAVEGATVIVNSKPVLTLKTASVDGLSPKARAELIASNLAPLNASNKVTVKAVGKTRVLMSSALRLVTITPQEATAHHSSIGALARGWANNINAALVTPALVVATTNVRMPCPSNQVVSAKGHEFGKATVSSDNSEVVTPIKVPGGIKLAANKPGVAVVTLQGERSSERIEVTVQPYAAVLPQTLSCQVAGSPAQASTVRGAIEGVINTQLQRLPGSAIRIVQLEEQAVGDGLGKTFQVKVRVAAEDAYESTGFVNVVVRNYSVPVIREQELWYCNDPENINAATHLFAADLWKGVPVRLLYHHQNTATFPLLLRVQVVNNTDREAKVLVIPGDSDPDKNPVRAGLLAAQQYIRPWASGSGEIITIPPRSTMPLSLRRLSTMETVSGLCALQLVAGPEQLLVRSDSWPPFPMDKRWQNAVVSKTPWREVGCNPINDYDTAAYRLSAQVYPNPFKEISVQYRYGENWKFFKIGERPISGSDNQRVLSGNFGVVYNITGEIINPTNNVVDIELVFEASAGYSGGIFFVNGAYKESPLLQPKAEFRVERFRLLPNDVKRFDLTTMPLSGSSYPAQLTVRPVQELSTGVIDRR
jgi:hypothetical protein